MALNIIVLGITGLLSIPSLTSFLSPPQPDKISINIGVGATNSSLPDGNPGGNCPSVDIEDVNGIKLGFGQPSNSVITDGGTEALSIGGDEGSSASATPEYIRLYATGNDAVCIAWFSTTSSASDGGDFRTWNGAMAQFCGLPWYPSTALFPGMATTFQPPCTWLSSDGRFPSGFSARLTDFFFPGQDSGQANDTATQWLEFPDTLCKAPARQQFYNTSESCIPFYPSGLSIVNEKNDTTGFDLDFDAIESSYTMNCKSSAGIPFNNNVNIGQKSAMISKKDLPTTSYSIDTTTASLATSISLGRLVSAVTGTTSPDMPPAITEAAHLPEKKRALPNEPVLNRREEKRSEEPHQWCAENQLVISEYAGHSAVEVCESLSSWGPDFVSVAEGVFCDMCLRQTYPLCGDDGNKSSSASGSTSFTASTSIVTTSTAISSSPTVLSGSSSESSVVEESTCSSTSSVAPLSSTTSSTTSTTSTTSSTTSTTDTSSITTTDTTSTGFSSSSWSSSSSSSSAILPTSSSYSIPDAPVNHNLNTSSGSGGKIGTCFDLKTNQLRAPARRRRDGSVPVKNYNIIKHWK